MDMEVSVVVTEGGVKSSKTKKSIRKTGGGNKGKKKAEQHSIVTANKINNAVSPSSSQIPTTGPIPINHSSEDAYSVEEEEKEEEYLAKNIQLPDQNTSQQSCVKVGVNNPVDDNNADAADADEG